MDCANPVWYMCKHCKICINDKFKARIHVNENHLRVRLDNSKAPEKISIIKTTVPTSDTPLSLLGSTEEPLPQTPDNDALNVRVTRSKSRTCNNSKLQEVRVKSTTVDRVHFLKPNSANPIAATKIKTPPVVIHRFKCQHCPSSFKVKEGLIVHTRVHTGERPFKCSVCHKGFSQVTNLNNHLRTHTGERPFSCNFCHKSFTQVTNLNYHVRIHTGEKPYQCIRCGMRFAQSANWKTHTEKVCSSQK